MKFKRAQLLLLAGVMSLAGCKKPGDTAADNSAPPDANQRHDFTTVEYYGPPHPTQMKTRTTGADAEPLEGGLIAFKQLQIESFDVNGRTQFVANAPECVYDLQTNMASSPGHLEMASGDGKIRVEGDGFLWRRSDSSLTISNNVKTLIASAVMAAASLNFQAQTNLDTTTNETIISSDSVNFNLNTRTAVYRGNVHVEDPQMKMTCELITASLPPSGGRPNHIVAETNVVIDFADEGQTNHVTCDKAIYDYSVENGMTNETAIFTGHARAKIAHNVIIIGEPLGWNPEKGFFATNETMIFPQGLESLKGETNLPLIK
ncbi:MAG TPA: hypothetical protein VMB22_06120 [Verrucomicrobiae bacterium]|nr:hypothetical protein [Verrucomicrobiae bacterium]